MTNYRATLLIDNQYASDNYSKWATPEAADADPVGMVVTCKDILYLMERKRRKANNGGSYHYWRWDDPSGLQRPSQDWLVNNLGGGAEIVSYYFDMRRVERVQGSVYICVYKTTEGTWELAERQGCGVLVYSNSGSSTELMSRIEAARHVTSAMGVARWEEAN